MPESEFEDQEWDKKKILLTIITVAAILGIGYSAKTYFLDKNTQSSIPMLGQVKGIQKENDDSSSKQIINDPVLSGAPVSLPSKEDVQQRLEQIKKEIQTINVVEIASSSPQVQKVLNDIKALEQYPGSQTKQMCENICKSL